MLRMFSFRRNVVYSCMPQPSLLGRTVVREIVVRCTSKLAGPIDRVSAVVRATHQCEVRFMNDNTTDRHHQRCASRRTPPRNQPHVNEKTTRSIFTCRRVASSAYERGTCASCSWSRGRRGERRRRGRLSLHPGDDGGRPPADDPTPTCGETFSSCCRTRA